MARVGDGSHVVEGRDPAPRRPRRGSCRPLRGAGEAGTGGTGLGGPAYGVGMARRLAPSLLTLLCGASWWRSSSRLARSGTRWCGWCSSPHSPWHSRQPCSRAPRRQRRPVWEEIHEGRCLLAPGLPVLPPAALPVGRHARRSLLGRHLGSDPRVLPRCVPSRHETVPTSCSGTSSGEPRSRVGAREHHPVTRRMSGTSAGSSASSALPAGPSSDAQLLARGPDGGAEGLQVEGAVVPLAVDEERRCARRHH